MSRQSVAAREAYNVMLIRENTFARLFDKLIDYYTEGIKNDFGRQLMIAQLQGWCGDDDVDVGDRIEAARYLLPQSLW